MFRDTEWDPLKAALNLRKHGVAFADAVTVLEDPLVSARLATRNERRSYEEDDHA